MYQSGKDPSIDLNDQPSPTSTPMLKEDDKMPLFLIKLWNIVADPSLEQIIRWDESGYSFHIIDPYSFCRNVLPHYFKHNNINSLIRQLNMYGFRKMTPIDRGGLTRAESDQDHLEFSHPYFVRDRPELLVNIKRKSSGRTTQPSNDSSEKVNQNLSVVMDELRSLREKQKSMSAKMEQIVQENQTLWDNISHQRAQHLKQQQVVSKLVQFIVALVQPNINKSTRLGSKRNLLAIDEPPNKRMRNSASTSGSQLSDILDRLQRDLIEGGLVNGFPNLNNCEQDGPIIADITDEMQPSPPQQQQQQQNRRNMGNNQNFTRPFAPPNIPRAPRTQPQQYQMSHTTQPNQSQYAQPQKNIQQSVNPNYNQQNPDPSVIQLSPSIDRALSNELTEYLTNVDAGIDNCRDLLGGQWNYDFGDNIWDEIPNQNQAQAQLTPRQQQQLALEDGVVNSSPESNHARDMLVSPGPISLDVFPGTPDLLTPIQSPHHQI